jgi:hypothetical protein
VLRFVMFALMRMLRPASNFSEPPSVVVPAARIALRTMMSFVACSSTCVPSFSSAAIVSGVTVTSAPGDWSNSTSGVAPSGSVFLRTTIRPVPSVAKRISDVPLPESWRKLLEPTVWSPALLLLPITLLVALTWPKRFQPGSIRVTEPRPPPKVFDVTR